MGALISRWFRQVGQERIKNLLTEIDVKAVAAGPATSFLTRFLGHVDSE